MPATHAHAFRMRFVFLCEPLFFITNLLMTVYISYGIYSVALKSA
jgi:hypothetical protein